MLNHIRFITIVKRNTYEELTKKVYLKARLNLITTFVNTLI